MAFVLKERGPNHGDRRSFLPGNGCGNDRRAAADHRRDRQAVIDMFQRNAYDDWNQGVSTTWANAFSECADMVEDIPSADMTEVVRCADCKHSYESVAGLICSHGVCVDCVVRDDFYCSLGERKDV